MNVILKLKKKKNQPKKKLKQRGPCCKREVNRMAGWVSIHNSSKALSTEFSC